MAINVQWTDSAALLAQLARKAGQGQLATRAQEQALDQGLQQQRFQQGLSENARQNDLNLAFRAQQAAIDNQQQNDALYANQQYQQQQLAANAWNAQQQRDASIYGQQLDYANASQNRDATYATNSIDAMEKSMSDGLAFAQKLNLDDEGKRKLAEFNQHYRAISGQRGVTIRDGEAYAGALSSLMSDFDKSGIDQHEKHEPTPDELWQKGTRMGDDGTTYGLDRNGTWRKLKDPPVRQLTPEEIHANTYTLGSGETMFISPIDGKPYFPKTPNDPNAVKPFSNVDAQKEIDLAIKLATANALDGDGQRRPFTDKEFQDALASVQSHRATGDPNYPSGFPQLPASVHGQQSGQASMGPSPIPNYNPNEPQQYDSGNFNPTQPAQFQELEGDSPSFHQQSGSAAGSAPPQPTSQGSPASEVEWYQAADPKVAYRQKYGYTPTDSQAKFDGIYDASEKAGDYDIKAARKAYEAIAPGLYDSGYGVSRGMPVLTEEQVKKLPSGIPYVSKDGMEVRYSGMKYKGAMTGSYGEAKSLEQAKGFEIGSTFSFNGKRYVKTGADSAEEY